MRFADGKAAYGVAGKIERNERIGIFAALPLRSLDRLNLQNKLREIGRMEGATASTPA